MPVTTARTTLALKEWGAAVHALLDGRQTILLRKGGIHEKRFDVAIAEGSDRFVLFPTVAHSHAERVRPEHRDLLAPGAADVADDRFTVRAGISLVGAVPVRRPDRLPQIRDLHIWTDESIREDRLAFRPRHLLQVLVVRAVALPDPVELPRLDDYGGCKSWIDLPAVWDGVAGAAVHDDGRLAEDAARVRAAVG
jgi:hypothetical protein